MKDKIEKFISMIQSFGHSMAELGFSEGASEKEIKQIETKTKQVLSDDFKLFLTYFNGQKNDDFYFLPDQVKLLSASEIIDEWTINLDYVNDEFYNEFQDNDRIRDTICSITRIPIALQEGFGVLCIDNDPGPKGKVGQLIFLVDECNFIVLADSFSHLIDLYIENIENGILKIVGEDEGCPNKYRLRSDNYDIDGESFAAIFFKN